MRRWQHNLPLINKGSKDESNKDEKESEESGEDKYSSRYGRDSLKRKVVNARMFILEVTHLRLSWARVPIGTPE